MFDKKKSSACFVINIFAIVLSSCLYAAQPDNGIAVSSHSSYSPDFIEFKDISGLSTAYPAYFDLLDPAVFQSFVPEKASREHKMKIIFFALNKASGEPKIIIARSEYRKGMNIEQILKAINNDSELLGGIQETWQQQIEGDSALTETSAITSDGDIFISKSKLFLVNSADAKNVVVYQISAGATFNDYYKYLSVIDAVMQNSRFNYGGK